MAIFEPKDPSTRIRASLTGVIMQDVHSGTERVRTWPKKRGTPKSQKTKEQVEKFTLYQKSFPYAAPLQQAQMIDARRGTPLLPRDLWTMMMSGTMLSFTMPDGRIKYPMQSMQKVSESLDVISQDPGSILMRGTKYWVPIPYVAQSAASYFFGSFDITADADFIDITGIPDTARDLRLSISARTTDEDSGIICYPNADIDNNKTWCGWNKYGSNAVLPSAYWWLGESTRVSAPVGWFSEIDVTLKRYCQPGRTRTFSSQFASNAKSETGAIVPGLSGGLFDTTDPITSLRIAANNGQLAAGTSVDVYLESNL